MLFLYKALDNTGQEKSGSIDALNVDIAISTLQRQGLVITSIDAAEDRGKSIFAKQFTFLQRIKSRDMVILSRQMATLFEAQVSALRVFRLLAAETENPKLAVILDDVASNLQGGSSISDALSKHPDVFTSFYVSMVKAGEESGNLDETFVFLADYIDRTHELQSKAKNALIYPSFVVITFIAVMILMFTMVIPRISEILTQSGQEIPIFTTIILGISNFLVSYWVWLLLALIIGGVLLYRLSRTPGGREELDHLKITFPYVGNLYTKLYLSRISDNMNTMLGSGISMVKSLELTQDVVDNQIFKQALEETTQDVQGGTALSDALGKHEEFPTILVQMVKVGEETGNLGEILKTLSNFYRREVLNAIDALVGLIEPVMIILLGIGVGILLMSVLVPIYNISTTF